MLSQGDNETLVRASAGTGAPMRRTHSGRFWVPALLSSEVAERDGPPARVNILGEKLVAFRDTNGRVGLLDTYCPHRRANLFWGRNEECGLRCVYHGWKFDVTGECVDVPNVPEGDTIRHQMKTISYPTFERAGIVWAFLGPAHLRPETSFAEVFELPDSHRYIQKVILRGNWIQFMEGDIDSSHVSFLHSSVRKLKLPGITVSDHIFSDKAPQWTIKNTDYGLLLAARRQAGNDASSWHWRVNQWMMPYVTQIAAPEDSLFISNVRVPIDDESSIHFRVIARHNRPLDETDHLLISGGTVFADLIPGTFDPEANPDNDFLIDRELQKAGSFTGMKAIPTQDYAVTYRQGGGLIADRSREKLIKSDGAIVAMRRRLLEAAKALQAGHEPPEASQPEAYRVRSIDKVLPREVDIVERAQVRSVTRRTSVVA